MHTQAYIIKKQAALSKTSKICIHCKIERPIDHYSKDRKHLDGKHPVCRECKKVEQRALYKKQPERFRATSKKAYYKNTEKASAREKVNRALKSGKLNKPKTCENCGISGGRIEGHHYKGYDYPLDVQWLCTPCHCKADLTVNK